MNSMQHMPLFESTPRQVKRAPEAAPAVSGRKDDRQLEGDEAGVSFPSLLEQKTDRQAKPEAKAAEVVAKDEAAVVKAEADTAQMATESGALDLEKVMAMLTETADAQKAAVVGPQVPLETTSASVAGDVPAILAQGLAVQGQAAAHMQNSPTTAQPEAANIATPAEQLLAQVPAKAAPVVTGTPAAGAPVAEALVTETAATIESAVKSVAEAATVLSATELETVAKGRETYSQVPVVSESQMMTDTLKNASRNSTESASQTALPEAAELPVPTVDTSADAGTNAETDSKESALPQAESEPAPLSLEAEMVKPLEQAVNVPHEVVSDAPQTDAPAAVNLDPSALARPAQTTVQAPATHLAADPTVSKSVKQQVVRHLSANLSDITGSQKITIKLNPESLGQIELNFEARDDRLTVAMSANTPEAEAALRDNMKDLTDRLVERSARFSQVDVRVEIKDGADTRQDNKQEQNKDQKNDDRRENAKQGGGNGQGHHGQTDQQSARAQEAWESAMSWQLANEEG